MDGWMDGWMENKVEKNGIVGIETGLFHWKSRE